MALSLFAGLPSGARGSPAPGPTPAATTLRIGEVQQPDSLNPFVGVESASYIVWAHVYELLVGIGPDLTPIPSLAQSWSSNPAGTVWTFHLVQNATWHDNVPFTSADVNFTFRYIYKQTPLNHNNATTAMGCDLALLESYLGDYDRRVGVDVGNITTPDRYTIVIPTYQQKANILSMFIPILPMHLWGSIPCNQALHPNPLPLIGTGMYKFVTWQQGAYVQLALNTNYWRLDKNQITNYIGGILISYYADTTTLFGDFQSGAIDATDALTAAQFNKLKTLPPVAGGTSPNVGFYTIPSLSMSEMGACLASDALISQYKVKGGRNWLVTNRTIRQAMQLAVNRAVLVDTILGNGTAGSGLGQPGSTLIPPATPLWHLNVTSGILDANQTRAALLLDDPAGDGMTVLSGHGNDPGPYGQYLVPSATNNQDAFAAINPTYPNVRVPVNPARVRTGDEWGATGGTSAPNRPAPYPLSFGINVIDTDQQESDAADRMVVWWSQIGIQVTKSVIPESKQISTTYACSEDFYLWGWGGDVDPDFLLSVMTTPQILYWQDAWYSNKTYDAWYLQQQTEGNPYQRQQTIWNMQEKLYQDAAYLIMWYPYILTVTRTDTFYGWTGLGVWAQHPGLGLTGFGNDLIMLTVRAGSQVPPTNHCPTKPSISGTPPLSTWVNQSQPFSGSSMDPDAGQTLTWIWAWQDNTQNRTSTPSSVTENNATHNWTREGFYNVTLSVTDGICIVTSAPFEVIVRTRPAQLGFVSGFVTDSVTHAGIGGAFVDSEPGNYGTTTSASGGYSITLPPGTYAITAQRNLYKNATQSGVQVANNTVTWLNLTLIRSAGWIAGTVTNSANGQALQNAVIYAQGVQQYAGRTNANGYYNITVSPGTYDTNASLSGYYTKAVPGVQVTSGATTPVNFALDPVPQPSTGLSTLEIAAIALGVVAVIAVLVVALLVRRRRKAEEIVEPSLPPPKPPEPP